MSIAEEKADSYLKFLRNEGHQDWVMAGNPWTDESIKSAYAAGYAAAERYRLILQAAIRNATPQPESAAHHDD